MGIKFVVVGGGGGDGDGDGKLMAMATMLKIDGNCDDNEN